MAQDSRESPLKPAKSFEKFANMHDFTAKLDQMLMDSTLHRSQLPINITNRKHIKRKGKTKSQDRQSMIPKTKGVKNAKNQALEYLKNK